MEGRGEGEGKEPGMWQKNAMFPEMYWKKYVKDEE